MSVPFLTAHATTARNSARQEEDVRRAAIALQVRALVQAHYPQGLQPLDGGPLFRACAERWDLPERWFSELGRADGWWPWGPGDVEKALAAREWP